jgi:probable addiction module antidote protein
MSGASEARLRPFDVVEYLDSPERIAGYLEVVFEDGDPVLIAAALGDVARARGMHQLSEASGVSRAGLYKSLSVDGNPTLTTMVGVLGAFGLRLATVPVSKGGEPR